MHKKWRDEDFIPDEADIEGPWRGVDEVLADENLLSEDEVRELIRVGKD